MEALKDVLHITTYTIEEVIVNPVNLEDSIYKNMYTVDSINNFVSDGMSFREAYQIIGAQVQEGKYKPDLAKLHSHTGSMHNLRLDLIRQKFPNR